MSPTIILLVLLLVVGVIAVMVYVSGSSGGSQALERREREELDRLRELVADLKETAWDHRELDSALSVIILDMIRSHERRGRELGP